MTTRVLAVPVRMEMVPTDLIERAKEYARQSKSAATLKVYDTEWRIFTAWCSMHGVSPLPASPEVVAAYVVDRADHVRPVTIKRGLAAISTAHKVAGFDSPTASQAVRLTMQGLRRVKGTSSSPRRALRVVDVRKMISTVPDSVVGIRDRAIILLGFTGGMRRSEVVGLDVSDVTFEPEGIILTIRKSKRDQERRGRRVAVPCGRYEATCPVQALRAWLDVRGNSAGPLFVRLDAGAPRERLDGRAVAELVKRAVRRAGLDPVFFSGHSLRRGFATECARAGAAETSIMKTTGHASLVTMRGYIEDGRLFENLAASVLDL